MLLLDRDRNNEIRHTHKHRGIQKQDEQPACCWQMNRCTHIYSEGLIDSRCHPHFTVRVAPQISGQLHQQQFLLLCIHSVVIATSVPLLCSHNNPHLGGAILAMYPKQCTLAKSSCWLLVSIPSSLLMYCFNSYSIQIQRETEAWILWSSC